MTRAISGRSTTAAIVVATVSTLGCNARSDLGMHLRADERGGDSGSTSGQKLTDRGLVVRYYLDEAGAGQGPVTVVDSVDVPLRFDLNMTYAGPADPVWYEEGTGRGLQWSTEGRGGGACADLAGSELFNRLNGLSAATIEAVVTGLNGTGGGSRILDMSHDITWDFSLGLNDAGQVIFGINNAGSGVPRSWWAVSLMQRTGMTLVFDSTQAVVVDRVRLYINGVLRTEDDVDGVPPTDVPLDITLSEQLCIGNRESMTANSYDRSPVGKISYVAIYEVALSDNELSANSMLLLERDDP